MFNSIENVQISRKKWIIWKNIWNKNFGIRKYIILIVFV